MGLVVGGFGHLLQPGWGGGGLGGTPQLLMAHSVCDVLGARRSICTVGPVFVVVYPLRVQPIALRDVPRFQAGWLYLRSHVRWYGLFKRCTHCWCGWRALAPFLGRSL